MATEVKRLVNAEELLKQPEEDAHTELVEGEVVRMAPAGWEHGWIAASIAWLLLNHVRPQGLGAVFAAETGFLLRRSPDTVRAPDAAFVARERLPAQGEAAGYFPGAPDLAVEVVSPGDTAEYVQRKVEDWLAGGARLVWVVYPSLRQVLVYAPGQPVPVLGADDRLDGGAVLPGFSCRVADLFPAPD